MVEFNGIFDFFVDFALNIGNLFSWLFFERINIGFGDIDIQIVPIGFLAGGIAITVGILRRIL